MKFLTADVLKDMLKAANNYLKLHIDKINSLNVFPVPDGDTGTNMSATLDSSIKEINGKTFENVDKLMNAVAFGSLKGARGNSGVILSQLLRGFAKELKGKDVIDIPTFVACLKSASASAYKAVMKPTEGTMLTVARGIAEDVEKEVAEGIVSEIEDLLEVCVSSGKKWLAKTPEMLHILKEANVVDSGGMGLVIIFEGMYKFLKEGMVFEEPSQQEVYTALTFKPEDIRFTYCTEFFITGLKKNIEKEFKEYLETIGDSIIVIQDGDILKTHVHTNSPGRVLEKALKYGELINIKIDNMKYQHQEFISKRENPDTEVQTQAEVITKEYGFVAISQGEGFNEILKGLGVDFIIEGGQTMNPSAEDFVNAIKNVPAKNVFIFPNNKNVIMSAELSLQLINTNKNVVIMKTTNIPECIAAMIKFDLNKSVEENIKLMQEAIDSVKVVEVTKAVRNTKINGFEIEEGDFIGISKKEIIACDKDMLKVALACVEKIVDSTTQILSIYYGKDVALEDIEVLVKNIQERYPKIDIESYESGNEIYQLIIVAEM
ncbi:DAK2 domain fusion protein YloV [Caldicellulosiruptor acetigenus I77R1B]|uniref:DAK2 domain fusion protein YloV n=2 Tax=Caldicellulosiruptor acetigenus TaxID=301953 RepID=G2PT00_9FIRM|nr:DAK2 domain-containing protein [Caldicellulosiruptor acetigenus]ADQ40712.1 DAK2 domain fusion protein YloV [Caldicellulosiruptor acetigenus I77R1B]AEM73263.1 DAK2 domain fusion protein YloV [Caldicellulosiruptor acetigenus 6A]WAM35183.1 DAK2 domain-containing protein [Caldicellulosiruptor acetigenus]